MQMVESADGTIRVIELDPTKTHFFVIEEGAMDEDELDMLTRQKLRDGLILRMRKGTHLAIVEGHDPASTINIGGA